MMTDEQLIERIRTSLNADVEDLQPPPDLLNRLQSAPTFGFERHPGLPSRLVGALALVVSAAVVVLVVALAVPGHRGAPSTGMPTVPAGSPDSARSLVARMAVFRRPQTAADRLPASVSAQLMNTAFHSVAIPSLTRLAATFNGGAQRPRGESIYVVVGTYGHHVDLATAVVVTGAAGHRYLVTPPEVVEEQTAIQTGGLTPSAVAADNSYVLCGSTWCKGEPLPGGKGVTVAVVPDGVTRVKWVFNRVIRRFRRPSGPPMTVYPRVENNLAVSNAVSGVGGLVSATWYGANGEVIKPLIAPLPPTPRRPVPAVVGRSFAALRGVSANHAVAIASHTGMRLSLVPHPTQMCIFYRPAPSRTRRAIVGGGGGCVPISMALDGNFTLGLFGKGETLIGVAPNGNRTVTLTVRDLKTKARSKEVVGVSQNVYVARTPHLFETVTLKDAKGELRTWRTP